MQIPKCINNHQAEFICMDKNCTNLNPFICATCPDKYCMLVHKNCIMKKWINFKKEVTQTIPEKTLLRPQDNQYYIIEDTILKSISELEKEKQKFKAWRSSGTIAPKVTEFFNSIKMGKYNKYCGKQISKIFRSNNKGNSTNRNIKLNHELIKDIHQKIEVIKKSIRQLYAEQDGVSEKSSSSKRPSMRNLEISNVKEIQVKSKSPEKQTKTPLFGELIKESEFNTLQKKKRTRKQFLDQINEQQKKTRTRNNSNLKQDVGEYIRREMIQQVRQRNLTPSKIMPDKIIKQTYPLAKNIIKIKNIYLSNVNNKLADLKERPQQLEIKFPVIKSVESDSGIIQNHKDGIQYFIQESNYFINIQDVILLYLSSSGQPKLNHFSLVLSIQSEAHYAALKQFAFMFRNQVMETLKVLTIYYPSALGLDDERIKYQKMLAKSLLSIPKFQILTIITDQVKSDEGFRILGHKLIIQKDQSWLHQQKWY